MATETISVIPYDGALLEAQLLSNPVNIVLGDFGGSTSGTLTDDDGTLSDADDGIATFEGQPLNYIGSGTAQAGVDVAGITVGIGTQVDVVVFEAGGQIYFYYPAGRPSSLGQIAEVIDIDPTAYPVFTPVCFCSGTLIRTTDGDIPVEEIGVGTQVIDIEGKVHPVRWSGSRRLTVPVNDSYRKWYPVRIARNTFGDGVPYVDTYVSQQHRLLLRTAHCQIIFGEACLAPAVNLVNGCSITVDATRSRIEYHHILCDSHVVLLANGMAAESMFLGDVAMEALGAQDYDTVTALFAGRTMEMAFPVLRSYEARAISQADLVRSKTKLAERVSRTVQPAYQPEPRY
ncbi:Hint domain-containing protein [Oceaniglobus roseus]|uniref:Hint domain-containing protein n=1 Tax=Oceaniglobus roseus TaxID=1737570 RepID=UPI000C7E8CEA|nr:Hint domain-containing protein [Kandeliimicrobium roseum]